MPDIDEVLAARAAEQAAGQRYAAALAGPQLNVVRERRGERTTQPGLLFYGQVQDVQTYMRRLEALFRTGANTWKGWRVRE